MSASQTVDPRTCAIFRSEQSCRKRQDASVYSLSRSEGVKCAGRLARGRVGERAVGRAGGWEVACLHAVRATY